MIELTVQQQKALDQGPQPPRLVDPRTRQTYVLVATERFERLQGLLEESDDLSMRQVAILVEQAMREDDGNDPTLAFYQQMYGTKE